MNIIKNVVAIDQLKAGEIIGWRRMSKSCVHVSSSTPWQSVSIKIPARLTFSDKIEEGVRIHNSQLVFKTCEDIEERDRKIYRCKTADGRYYLIGSNERPYPISTVSEVHPDNMTDSQLNEVTVIYKSATKIPYIQ